MKARPHFYGSLAISMNLSNLYTLVCQEEFQTDSLRNHNECR